MLRDVGRILRNISPYYTNVYNDILINRYKWIDLLDPRRDLKNRPSYENGIVSAIYDTVREDDTVIILGGGLGVATAHVDRVLDDDSVIYVYEASEEMVKIHKRTEEINNIGSNVNLINKMVGETGTVWGSSNEVSTVNPACLPEADILISDIEGAEKSVIPQLKNYERLIIETHGLLGSPTSKMMDYLTTVGYNTRCTGVAEPSMRRKNINDDVKVIRAIKG
jgi:hypothetical protein